MILPKVRDSRFTLVRRGGSLSDATVTEAKVAAYHANSAAMTTSGPAKDASYARRDLVLEDQRNRNSICWDVFFDEVP